MTNAALERIEMFCESNAAALERIEDKLLEHDKIFATIHAIMKEILANLTEETGGDLAMALRKLTEAVNSLGVTVAAHPNVIVSKLRKEMKVDGSNN